MNNDVVSAARHLHVGMTSIQNGGYFRLMVLFIFSSSQANTDVVVGGSSAEGSFVQDR